MSKKPIPDARPQEQWMLDQSATADLWKFEPESAPTVLSNTLGFAQFAAGCARKFPQAKVICHFFDLFGHRAAEEQWRQTRHGRPSNTEFICSADLPQQPLDRTVWFASHRGDAELTRDAFQQAHEQLRLGGELWTVTDNPRDKWLHEQLTEMLSKVHRIATDKGVIYWGKKTAPLKKHRDFSSQFPAKVDDHLLQLRTRPGVFSHRHVDPGARALLQHVTARPQDRVLDFGCGGGFVALAIAKRFGVSHVLAIDSNTRAVECTAWGAEQNHLPAIEAKLGCDSESIMPATYDLAAINPPYFGNYRVAEHFVDVSQQALRNGGQIVIVTKTPQWYLDYLPQAFTNVTSVVEKSYVIVKGTRRTR